MLEKKETIIKVYMNMKQKIFSLLVLLVVAVTGAWAQDADNCPKIGQLHKRVTMDLRRVAANIPSEPTFAFDCTSGYQYGVVSDGEYIYLAWQSLYTGRNRTERTRLGALLLG